MQTTTTEIITEAQFSTLVTMICEKVEAGQARHEALMSLGGMTKQAASALIAQYSGVPTKVAAKVPAGTYLYDGKIYHVKISKTSGANYLLDKWGSYLGAKGWAGEILGALTQDHMAAYGKTYGKCGICHKTLTDPASIAAGIGPVCAKKF